MKRKIINKQYSGQKCLVCGVQNEFGLKGSFYELDNGELLAIFAPREEHQGYPGRLHGGIAAAILDETIGRAVIIKDGMVWGVTVELTLKYKKPVPLDGEIKVIGRITRDSKRLFEGTGEILLADGEVAVSAFGKYLKMPIGKISDLDENDPEQWQLVMTENELQEIDI